MARKIIVHVMPKTAKTDHKFLTICRTKMNTTTKRYVETGAVCKVGLMWPMGTTVQTRADLARLIGEAILNEAGV